MSAILLRPRQYEILRLLYRFRFLTRLQIQHMLDHKNHRQITAWLNDLHSTNCIRKFHEKTIPSSPAIYALGPASRRYLKQDETLRQPVKLDRIKREKEYSETFRNHCLAVAHSYLALRARNKQNNATLHFSTKVDLDGIEGLIAPLPDAYVALVKPSGEIDRYFLEVFDNVPPRIMRRRIRQYIDYYESGEWQSSTDKPLPDVKFICVTQKYLRQLRYLTTRANEGNVRFYVALLDEDFSLIASSGVGRR